MKPNPFVLFVDLWINVYRYFISPILPHSCRFYPSCSEYALQAFRKYGFLKGSWLTLKRLTKCHPLSAGGYDPIS
ncbi:MAG TPA: membrane protein insertion efficiency factor YidD [Thermodesulfobacteriota bacterium]|nr:membrane protein insertion efficiency factor YidD [Thermodesulfobacteriota bacterium]